MDKSVIPNGFYCYGVRVNSKYNNIPYTEDIDFFDYYDKVICPYWNNIGNGLIKCDYLNQLTLNLKDSDCEKKSLKYFNGDKSKVFESDGYLFWDKVKDCGVNIDIGNDNDDFELISDEKLQKINQIRDRE